MEAVDLRVLEVVARLGAMSRAAAELNTVQSNVTARIRRLEARLGVTLFDRGARGVALTAAGRRLLPYAQRIHGILEEACRAARDDGTPRGMLCVGSLETTAAMRLGPALAHFTGSFPDVDLTLRTGTTCELLAQVLAYDVEGAFVCGPVAHAALETEVVMREELVLLSAPGADPFGAMGGERGLKIVVLRAGCSYRQRLEDHLIRRGIPTPRLLEFGTLEAIFSSVEAGLGITLLPRGLVGQVLRSGRLAVHALPGGEGQVETLFVRRRDAHCSSTLRAFLASVRQHSSIRSADSASHGQAADLLSSVFT